MEENIEMPTVKSMAMKWGPILGLVSIAFFLVTIFGDLVGNQAMSWIGVIPLIAIIYLAHKEFKDNGDGYMSYGQGLGIGTMISVVSGLIYVVFFYAYIKFIDSTYIQLLKDIQLEDMQEKGMSDPQIETAMSMSEGLMTPEIMAVFAILISVFFGFLVSLIISAITKNKNPALEV
jgi:hypothetical protein